MGLMTAFHFGHAPITCPQDAVTVPDALKAILHLDLIAAGLYYARRGMINLALPTTEADATAFGAVVAARAELIHAAVAD